MKKQNRKLIAKALENLQDIQMQLLSAGKPKLKEAIEILDDLLKKK